MSLPTPVLSDDDIVEVQSSSDESARLIWNTWSQDPVKAVVLHAMLSCLFDIPSHPVAFRWIISVALGQNKVCTLRYFLLKGEEVHYLNVFRILKKFVISSLP